MKTILITVGIIFIIAGMSHAINKENVMGMWLLDEDGGDIAGDSSGNGNDGVLTNGPEWVEGVFGTALQFSGSNNVIIEDHPTLDEKLNDGFTFVCWQNQPAGDADGGYIVKEEGWQNKMCYRFFSNHGNDFGFMVVPQDGTVLEFYAGTPQDDTWHHVTAIYDGSDIIGYMDGKEVGRWAYDMGVADTDARVFIGSGHPTGEYFPGMLDDLALFNVVLSEDEINDIMDNGLEEAMAVSSPGKLATSWGHIKHK